MKIDATFQIMQEAQAKRYNVIVIINGKTAGQTIPHCHIHLIPRRKGDVKNPIGGIRNTIPGKGDYTIF